ncbi:MAG TPA: alcohol dehydrogenase catalytic domain-containing protein [Gaiella sp.]|uniref:alcohol dehydrogenase catalytic domain-containing protein n=1 Tax=Gaiella sp. TaxID=2663207 RepID=UPI002D7F6AF9|nr:alcohol dehydrogenase catalytic domain-containing protein [Gaiella sp.]HET9287791.1 alcohol dehydrogenase catalytic domain-containing protein [Gaiella sp.]
MKTRAALFHAVGEPLEVAEIELEEPRPDEVVVRMAAVGICGTDLHQVRGEFRRPTPMVLGHEGAGVVEEVGEAVTMVRPGDEVVLSWAPSCGECAGCRRGRPATCRPLNAAIPNGTLPDGTTRMSYRGETVYRGTATGCLADRVVVTEKVALPLVGALPFDQAALLGCAVLTGVGAVLYAAKVVPDASVVVIGAGGVGQFVVQGARIAGASTIVVCDPVDARLEAARGAGATHVAAPDDLRDLIRSELPDGADYGFDAVGDPATSATALRFTRDGGTTVIVGLPAQGLRLDLDPFELIRKEKLLTGTLYGSQDPAISLPAMLDLVRAGRLDLASTLGPSFPLERVDEAVQASLAGEAGRVLVVP